jgi:hypothetical protein
VLFGIRCCGPRGDLGVEVQLLGENHHVEWMGQCPVCEAWLSTATASSLWAERKGCGGALREVDTPCGTQLPVGAEPLCGLGCVRLG